MGGESRDFVYVDDVVDATCRALLHTEDQPHGLVLNVGTGVPVSIMDLARTLVRIGGWHVPIRVTGGYRLGDVRHSFADTQKTNRVLGLAAATPSTKDSGGGWHGPKVTTSMTRRTWHSNTSPHAGFIAPRKTDDTTRCSWHLQETVVLSQRR